MVAYCWRIFLRSGAMPEGRDRFRIDREWSLGSTEALGVLLFILGIKAAKDGARFGIG